MKMINTVKEVLLGVIGMVDALTQIPATPFIAFALAMMIDGVLHNMQMFTLSLAICSVLAVLAVIAALRNLSAYGGVKKALCLVLTGFLALHCISGIDREVSEPVTPAPAPKSAVTAAPYVPTVPRSKTTSSTGMRCFFCEPGRVGVCDTCEGDGRYEVLENSIWGSWCRECEGSGVCNGCKGDGIMGN